MTQEEYIAILFDACNYDTQAQRKGWIKKRFGYAEFPDELTANDRSRAIQMLKDEKLEKGGYEREDD